MHGERRPRKINGLARLKRCLAEEEERCIHIRIYLPLQAVRRTVTVEPAASPLPFCSHAFWLIFFFSFFEHCSSKNSDWPTARTAGRPSGQDDVCVYKQGVSCRTSIRSEGTATTAAMERSREEECETPCTYTECILSVFLSGIPSVYVTGGFTAQRWTTHGYLVLGFFARSFVEFRFPEYLNI